LARRITSTPSKTTRRSKTINPNPIGLKIKNIL